MRTRMMVVVVAAWIAAPTRTQADTIGTAFTYQGRLIKGKVFSRSPFWGLVLTVLLLLADPAAATNGIECDCATTGDYVNPARGVAPRVVPTSPNSGTSPNGVYRVTASLTGSIIDLTVTRIATEAVVLTLGGLPLSTSWGFSPDDDRFVYYYRNEPVHNVFLHNLVGSNPRVAVKTYAVRTGSSRVQFSPSGRYFFYSAMTDVSRTLLSIVDARTGARAYETEFDFQSPPDSPGDSFGVAGWGFSPDDFDRTFVYAYVSSQTSVEWFIVNLTGSSNSSVHYETIRSISASWKFSLCGDLIGIDTRPKPGDQVLVRLFGTLDGFPAGAGGPFAFAAVVLRSDLTSHIANVGGTDYTLATNTADNACTTTNIPPTAAFTPPSGVRQGVQVVFTDASTDSDGTIVSWLWNFGDEVTSTLRNPTHTYTSSGTFDVSLQVTDNGVNGGATDSVTHAVTVSSNTCTDTDGDGFGDPGFPDNTCTEDNCPTVANPGQEDADTDGVGNVCDTCTDTDGDGFGDPGFPANTCTEDNCPAVANPGQEDADTDGVGNVCDTCTDTDRDGFGNPGFAVNTCAVDNCPAIFNRGQEDCQPNGVGDVCDIAAGTGPDCNCNEVPDGCDIAAGTSTDVNGNGVLDECDTPMPGDCDRDFDVDLVDFGCLWQCWEGPGTSPGRSACRAFDFDADGDVDEADFAVFQNCFSGADVLADPNCVPLLPLVGWGNNGYGQIDIPAGTFIAVAAGDVNSLAIRSDGTLVVWGWNCCGQTNVPSGTFTAVAAGGGHSLAIRSDGTLVGWGDNSVGQINVPAGTFTAVAAGGGHSLAIRTDGSLAGWGLNNYGQIDVPAGTFVAVAAGEYHSLAIRSDGTLAGWGDNFIGQIDVPTGTFTAVAARGWHSLAIRSDGTLAGWGDNNECQNNVPAGTFTAVDASIFHGLAIRSDGTLAGWGNGVHDDLNKVPTGTFTAVAAGRFHSLAIRSDPATPGDF